MLDGVFTPSTTFIITNTLNISPINGPDIHPIRNVYYSQYDRIYPCASNYKRLKRGEYPVQKQSQFMTDYISPLQLIQHIELLFLESQAVLYEKPKQAQGQNDYLIFHR